MTQPDKTASDELAAQLAEVISRVTAIETMLNQKIPGFEQVGVRVSELSTAFQQANKRLAATEVSIKAIQEAPVPAGQEAITELSSRVDNLTTRVATMEQIRQRGGRLSTRLSGIEAAIQELKNQESPETPEEGGTE